MWSLYEVIQLMPLKGALRRERIDGCCCRRGHLSPDGGLSVPTLLVGPFWAAPTNRPSPAEQILQAQAIPQTAAIWFAIES